MSDARQCVILVGGLGTRLGALTRETPKPLLPVRGRPFVEWLLLKARREGFDRALLLAGHGAEVLDAWFAGDVEARVGLTLAVSREPHPLGTAGALVHAETLLEDRFLLVNGDTWFDFDWANLATAGGEAIMALRRVAPADRYETVVLEGDRVTGLRPRDPALVEGLINGGVYALSRSVLEGVSAPSSLEGALLPRLAREGRLRGRVCEGSFIDIGVPESYRAVQDMDLGDPGEGAP
ncbi:sugar phosphate nucleotidyltransferase [Caulobacter mirabilis]|uniref:Nucleotidyl transferase domain-containing protein n=1 Tax=Caulobacter mirabilis TaxID=69666 RepID=A0A2D2AZ77_9CAUL|nr:sugar phosphate nucleotidyltransferase [Caulobacter mirabilis]ATQ43285.1 hypothetical protein CSW64_13085 [Caulobacter mirabilis]